MFLTEDNLKTSVPSVFSNTHASNLTDNYFLIPTIDLIRNFSESGWGVSNAAQTHTRTRDPNFTKHMLRFREFSAKPLMLNELVPEIVLVNSHDGTRAFNLMLGIYRLVCSNGLIVGDSFMSPISIRHYGDRSHDLQTAIGSVKDMVPNIVEVIGDMRGTTITENEALYMARQVVTEKWGQEVVNNIDVGSFIVPRRLTDIPFNLWNVFNTLQENVSKGGIKLAKRSSRPLRSIAEVINLNRFIWDTASNILAYKKGALDLNIV